MKSGLELVHKSRRDAMPNKKSSVRGMFGDVTDLDLWLHFWLGKDLDIYICIYIHNFGKCFSERERNIYIYTSMGCHRVFFRWMILAVHVSCIWIALEPLEQGISISRASSTLGPYSDPQIPVISGWTERDSMADWKDGLSICGLSIAEGLCDRKKGKDRLDKLGIWAWPCWRDLFNLCPKNEYKLNMHMI